MPWNVDKDVSKFSSSSERSDPLILHTHSTAGDAKTVTSPPRARNLEAQNKPNHSFAQYGKTNVSSCATSQEGRRRPQSGHFQDVCGEWVFLATEKNLL